MITELEQLKQQIEQFKERELAYQELVDMLTSCITDLTKNDHKSATIRISRIVQKINQLKETISRT